MSKSRLCIASSVLYSSKFDACSDGARLLYMYLNAETNLIGEVTRPKVLANGLGFGCGALDELVSAGLVLMADDSDFGERFFITHHFVSNRLANASQRSSADSLLDAANGLVEFTGEWCKSAYRLSEQDVSTDSLQLDSSSRDVAPKVSLNPTKANQNEIDRNENSNPNGLEAVACPRCREPQTVAAQLGKLHGYCANCDTDFYLDPSTGEYVEQPL